LYNSPGPRLENEAIVENGFGDASPVVAATEMLL
jgi:hypothetical protein